MRVPGPGTITALETALAQRPARAARRAIRRSSRAAAPTARAAGKLTVKITLAATGRRLLGHSHGSHLRVRLFITYTPDRRRRPPDEQVRGAGDSLAHRRD